MLEPSSQKHNFLIPQVSPTPAAPPPPMAQPPPPPPSLVRTYSDKLLSLLSERPSLRATSAFDSDSRVFFHKVSCKLFDNLASLKLSFINDNKREISEPQLTLMSKYLSIHYDPDEQNALIRTSFDVGPMLNFNVAHDLKVCPLFFRLNTHTHTYLLSGIELVGWHCQRKLYSFCLLFYCHAWEV